MSTVLLVEDDESMRRLLAMVLGTDGHAVVEAADGAAAIAWLEQAPTPDLIVCDLMMWGMDGLRFLEWLRASPHAAVPVLIVTAMDEADTRRRVIAAGAADVMLKPVNAGDLRARVAALLAGTR